MYPVNLNTSTNENSFNLSFQYLSRLERYMFKNHENLVDLNLSNNSLFVITNGAFDELYNLEIINLSYNMIGRIPNDIFRMNLKLKEINLNNNFLNNIDEGTFSYLKNLQVLLLCCNYINKLVNSFLSCPKLKVLYLEFNRISEIDIKAFYELPDLICLNLSNNRIYQLNVPYFTINAKLECLLLDNNYIQTLTSIIFSKNSNLRLINLTNNFITDINNSIYLMYNNNLTVLELLNNRILEITQYSFRTIRNLKILRLTVTKNYECFSIRCLKFLIDFELCYLSNEPYKLGRCFWNSFISKDRITSLKLIFKKADFEIQNVFSKFTNLEYLHIEVLIPSNNCMEVNFTKQIKRLPKLQYLFLKNLNHFHVASAKVKVLNFETKNIKYLNLTGIKNQVVRNWLQYFVFLEYLNLSFSEIHLINKNALKSLICLQYLYLSNSHLSYIYTDLFKHNIQLKILDCSNCRIYAISEFSFKNLTNLQILDLRNNLLNRIEPNTFFGLPSTTNIYYNLKPAHEYSHLAQLQI